MKKIGIILAALVITMFFVSAVAAMDQNNPPAQREKFREDCAVQGSGYIEYSKKILDKEIAIDIEESMYGYTGNGTGTFAMTITEILNEGVRLDCNGNCTVGNLTLINDPIFGDKDSPVMVNFECMKMVQFDALDTLPGSAQDQKDYAYVPQNSDGYLIGNAKYDTPGFHGGMNAKVEETYFVSSLQKDETVRMTTTATFTRTHDSDDDEEWKNCKKKYLPYNANELNFDTKNAFTGEWGTDSAWKKVCAKDIIHHQKFTGDFQVDKNLIFKEEVTGTCKEDWKNGHGDC